MNWMHIPLNPHGYKYLEDISQKKRFFFNISSYIFSIIIELFSIIIDFFSIIIDFFSIFFFNIIETNIELFSIILLNFFSITKPFQSGLKRPQD